MSGKVHVGIGGWSFAPWRGSFYPAGLPQARELAHAAGRVTAIEINATFYRRQSPDSFRRWAAETPDGFVFAVKASRFCTNRRVLAEAGAAVEGFFAQGLTELGAKLGPILWQFAATKTFDGADVAAFLALLPRERDGIALRHVVEAAHPSFADPAFAALASDHGVAVALLDPEPWPHLATAPFTYARLQGMREEEPEGYTPVELDRWAGAARGWAGRGDVYLFAINGAKLRAPAAAEALIGRLTGQAR